MSTRSRRSSGTNAASSSSSSSSSGASARKAPTPRGATAMTGSKAKKAATATATKAGAASTRRSRPAPLAPAVAIESHDDDDDGRGLETIAATVATASAEDADKQSSSPPVPRAPPAKRRRRSELESLQAEPVAVSESEGDDGAQDEPMVAEECKESKEAPPAADGPPLAATNGDVACTIAYQLDEGGVPVFRPTWDEFKDFARFIEATNAVGAHYGMLKVQPPAEHVPNQSGFADVSLKEMLVQNPARQRVQAVHGYAGAFQVMNEDVAGVREATVAEFEGMSLAAEAQRSARERALVDEANWSELERRFWSSTLSNAPLYGADSPGTLFDEKCSSWNVGNLPSLLHALDHPILGVSLPFLYWGQWKSMFAFHKEDVDLYSINYLHFGHPKQWYTIPPRHAPKFEAAMKNIYPHQFGACREFMRHKEALVSTKVLKTHNVPYITTRQQRGEYVVLWPKAYHQGFNYGFNCAESVNFTTSSWFRLGVECGRCLCRADTVWVSAKEVAERTRKLQWLHRQEQTAATTAAAAAANNKSAEAPSASPPLPQLTLADVPSDYELDTSSIWLGLPTNPIHLKELLHRYYPQANTDASVMGRSMKGRSMAARGGGGGSGEGDDDSRGFLFHSASYNQVDPSLDDDAGFGDDANAAVCAHANCPDPLHRNHRALMLHYQTVHSAEARAAAAAAAEAAAAATSSSSTAPLTAVPVAAPIASTASGSKRKAAAMAAQ